MKNTILRFWHAGLLGVAALLLVLSVVTGLWAGWRAYERVQWVNRTYRVMEMTSQTASLRFLVTTLPRISWWWLRGGGRQSPFFSSGGAPVVEPQIARPSE